MTPIIFLDGSTLKCLRGELPEKPSVHIIGNPFVDGELCVGYQGACNSRFCPCYTLMEKYHATIARLKREAVEVSGAELIMASSSGMKGFQIGSLYIEISPDQFRNIPGYEMRFAVITKLIREEAQDELWHRVYNISKSMNRDNAVVLYKELFNITRKA